jgi:tape measure domain-containing protein
MATQVGEAVIRLSFDGKDVKASLDKVEDQVVNTGKKSGNAWGSAWTVAAGNLIAKGVGKAVETVTNQIDDAVYRADTLNRFPKVMSMMGYSADDAAASVEKLREGVKGIPTSLADVVSGTQRLAGVTKDLDKASDWTLAISDAMLITTGDVNVASNAMEQFMKMISAGRVDGQNWNTIMEASSPIMNELAQSLGYTGAELGGDFYTALQEGTLSIDDMMTALVKLDKEGGGGLESLHTRVETATGGIQATITNLQQSISNALVEIIQTIGSENIEAMITKIRDALVGVVKTLGNVVSFISENWSWLQPIIITLGTFAGTIIAINAALRAYQAVQTAVNAVQLAFTAIMNTNPIFLLITVIAGIVAALTVFFTQTETGRQLIQSFGETVGSVFGAIGQFIGGVATSIGQFFTGLWDGFKAGVQGAWDFITGIFGNLANFFGSIFSAAWEAVKNVFSTGGKIFMGIVDGITEAFRNIVNAIITGINHVVAIPFNAINGFLSFLKGIDILGVKPFDWVGTIAVPQIPLLAQGGFADGATGAIIGEAGPEVVLPLENNTGNWAGLLARSLATEMQAQGTSGTINVYMTNEINNQLDAQEIGRVMMQSIRRAA